MMKMKREIAASINSASRSQAAGGLITWKRKHETYAETDQILSIGGRWQ